MYTQKAQKLNKFSLTWAFVILAQSFEDIATWKAA